jgi:hypothetical protein
VLVDFPVVDRLLKFHVILEKTKARQSQSMPPHDAFNQTGNNSGGDVGCNVVVSHHLVAAKELK